MGEGAGGRELGEGSAGREPRGEEQEQGWIYQREQEKREQGEGITVVEWGVGEGNGGGEEFEGNRI